MDNPLLSNIGIAIKRHRHAYKITQKELAELANVPRQTIIEIENGKGNPTLETLNRLAVAFNNDLDIKFRKRAPKPARP